MLSRSECLKILQLDESAGPNAIKKAYRKLAFELHPDLNPGLPNAAKRFQQLNEAYVLLMQEYSNTSFASGGSRASSGTGTSQAGKADEKARADANKAYRNAKDKFNASQSSAAGASSAQGSTTGSPGSGTGPGGSTNNYTKAPTREEVLKDLLDDPFARRVFEDIYSSVRHKNAGAGKPPKDRTVVGTPGKKPVAKGPVRAKPAEPSIFSAAGNKMAGLAGGVKEWLRRQIDDEQIMYVPGDNLHPGARIRLQVTHGLNDSSKVIELTLPPEFKPGRPIRLKGMGKQIGNWKGDLYLRVYGKDPEYE